MYKFVYIIPLNIFIKYYLFIIKPTVLLSSVFNATSLFKLILNVLNNQFILNFIIYNSSSNFFENKLLVFKQN